MASAISSVGLRKSYPNSPDRPPALDGVDLEIPSGQVFGLIGRNGAGKTTFVRICATQLAPSSGRLSVLGHDVMREPSAIRQRIASVPQESRPLYWVTVFELIDLYLRARGMGRRDSRDRTDSVLEELHLGSVRNTQVSRLSGGMRRRAMVAMVLASDAEILFLDEPTTGLDPLARREVWEAIRRASRERRTVLLTTHYLDEAEILSSRLALLEQGKLVLEGTPQELRSRVRLPFRVTVDATLPTSELSRYGRVAPVQGGSLVFAKESDARELAMTALGRGAKVSLGPVSLEDIFLEVVGRSIEEDAPSEEAEA